jgi:Protein of unknown function (DUF3179)
MTISSGSHSRRSSRTPRSAADAGRHPRAWLVARVLLVVGVLAAVAAALSGDDRREPRGAQPAEVRGPLDLDRDELLGFVKQGFRGRTDFSRHAVPLTEFVPAGPPRDGIPPIDAPRFVSVGQAETFLSRAEPVAVLELGGEVRAYPLQILVWHEIVNDRVAGRPVAVTYCPLCNSTVAFSRALGDRTLDFGTTGVLRNSDLVMYDRQTATWWQQLTGEAVVGELTGHRLRPLASQILSWRRFRDLHPGGRVLSRDTGVERDYGSTPYVLYEGSNDPYLFGGRIDRTLPATERVAAVPLGPGRAVVYPFSRLRREAPINDAVGTRSIVVFFDPGVASPLDDATISDGERVGAAAVFSRSLDAAKLSFEPGSEPGTFRDRRTGSLWTMTGRAVVGPLTGRRLRPLRHDDQFWFALAAFFPQAEIRR